VKVSPAKVSAKLQQEASLRRRKEEDWRRKEEAGRTGSWPTNAQRSRARLPVRRAL